MRKKLTAEQKKERYEQSKAKFRAWYAIPENRAKKMAENAAYKDANRAKVNAQSRKHANEKKRITLVTRVRMEESASVWFISRAEMNTWLRANDMQARKNHLTYSYEGQVTGLWVKAGNEYYTTIFGGEKSLLCLRFSN